MLKYFRDRSGDLRFLLCSFSNFSTGSTSKYVFLTSLISPTHQIKFSQKQRLGHRERMTHSGVMSLQNFHYKVGLIEYLPRLYPVRRRLAGDASYNGDLQLAGRLISSGADQETQCILTAFCKPFSISTSKRSIISLARGSSMGRNPS